jgi:threonylcarbamoyladenosine tRNA methylthiotransferase MtaB
MENNINNINSNKFKVFFETFGCKVNYAETSRMLDEFTKNGTIATDKVEESDILVVNTCSVTKKADADARKAIRHALRANPKIYIIVTGCAAEINPFQFSAIPGVDLVVGNTGKFNILDYADGFHKNLESIIIDPKIENLQFDFAYSSEADSRTRAVLKIQDGCEYNCTYCVIPQARGKFRSMPFNEIIPTLKTISEKGFKEAVLVGINLSEYRFNNYRFADVLKAIEDSDVDLRVRISSIEPNILNKEIIDLISKSQKICPHFHLPLQSGSDTILKLMRRRYNSLQFRGKIELINSLVPNAGIGIDVITGFPGESEVEFEETYNFLNELKFSYLHVFSYSERENTLAITMENKVSENLKKERTNILRELSKKKTEEFYKSQLNTEREVIFEHKIKDDYYFGHTDNYIPIVAKSQNNINNTKIKVLLKLLINGKIEGKIL